MNKFLMVLVFTFLLAKAYGQQKTIGPVILTADFTNLEQLPLKVVIKKTNLGEYSSKSDTIKLIGKQFNYKTQLLEPQFLEIVFSWPNKKITSKAFWVVPETYKINFNSEMKPVLLQSNLSGINAKISQINNEISKFRYRADSLVGKVNYENQKIEDVEKRINTIRDSVDRTIDENIYKATVLANLNTPLGLYALCKYSERPYENQRIKSEPEKMEVLFNKLALGIRELPSAKIFSKKVALGKQLSFGKPFKNITLPDTMDKLVNTGSFRGKYLLIDFWASWCVPCRAENPNLVRAFEKYSVLGFQIISVTRDKLAAKGLWLKAIAKDQINSWPQLSDFDDLAQKTYGIRFIPTNYLIDPKGIIIGRDLNGEELDKKLIQLFNK